MSPVSATWETRWATRWKRTAERLTKHSFSRQDSILMAGIETKPENFKRFLKLCKTANVPKHLWEESPVGDPKGEVVDGLFVTANSLRTAHLAHKIIQRVSSPLRILEIGGGFGALARVLCENLTVTKYVLIDAPSMLKLQEAYLQAHGLEHVFQFTEIGTTPEWSVDLAININSFAEMSTQDVQSYLNMIRELLSPGGILYLWNKRKEASDFADYKFGKGWKYRSEGPAESDKSWVEFIGKRKS